MKLNSHLIAFLGLALACACTLTIAVSIATDTPQFKLSCATLWIAVLLCWRIAVDVHPA